MKKRKLSQDEEDEINEFMMTRAKGITSEPNFNEFLRNTKISIKCKNPKQKDLINSIKDNEITIAAGPAGTGKTFLACAQALKLLKTDSQYERIYLVKSVTVLDGEDLGYLPGDTTEKWIPSCFHTCQISIR